MSFRAKHARSAREVEESQASWKFKHPAPADFFGTMEDVGGRRLDWFWREWFIENPHFDQAIDTVVTKATGDTMDVAVFTAIALAVCCRFALGSRSAMARQRTTTIRPAIDVRAERVVERLRCSASLRQSRNRARLTT